MNLTPYTSLRSAAPGDSQSLPGFRTPPFYHFQAQTGVRFEPLPGERHPLEEDE